MKKLFLNVPFREKDAAKKCGAKWDAKSKFWFTDSRSAKDGIQKWIPSCNISSSIDLLVYKYARCWKCKNITPLIAFGTNMVYDTGSIEGFIGDYYKDGIDNSKLIRDVISETRYIVNEIPIVLSALDYHALPEIKKYIEAKYPFFKKGFSKTVGDSYYANHCKHCGMIQGNHYIFYEPGGEFWIKSKEEYMNLVEATFKSEMFPVDAGFHLYSSSEYGNIFKNKSEIGSINNSSARINKDSDRKIGYVKSKYIISIIGIGILIYLYKAYI